jgi:hypothetical protein
VKVPGGLGFAEFKGYETWETVAVSYNGKAIAVILGNPAMISAFKAGIPDNGKPVPDGAQDGEGPLGSQDEPVLPGRDGARRPARRGLHGEGQQAVPDGNGWGYAVFRYDAATDTFTPGTTADTPPQGNDAKCGVACHNLAKKRDYVFTSTGTSERRSVR